MRRAQSNNHDSSDRSWISISLDAFEMASNNYAKIEIYNLETMELVFQIDQDLETSRQLNFYHDIRNAYAFLKCENSFTRSPTQKVVPYSKSRRLYENSLFIISKFEVFSSLCSNQGKYAILWR